MSMLKKLQKKIHRQGTKAIPNIIADKLAPLLPSVFNPTLKQTFIELTNACNLNCRMCLRSKRPEGYMSMVLFKKVMDELAEQQAGYVSLNYGGESLLHPEFKQFLAYAMTKRRNIGSIGWITNGILFDRIIADLVLKLGVDWISFSLDGVGKVNDDIRRGAQYDVIERNILYLLSKRGTGIKPQVSIGLTHTTQTKAQIRELVDFWSGKADRIVENPCYNKSLKFVDLENYLRSNRNFTSNYATNHYCKSPFATLAIYWNGDVVPCCYDINGSNLMGNVSQRTIKNVWLGEKYKTLRLSCVRNSFPSNSICHFCDLWESNLAVTHYERNGCKPK